MSTLKKFKQFFLKKPEYSSKSKIHHDLLHAWLGGRWPWHGHGKSGKKKSKKFILVILFALILGLAGSFLVPFYRQKTLVHADSLIKLDEGNGTSANDTNLSVSAGTITGAVWKPEDLCKSGKCMFFDGTQDYVSFTDDADLDFAAADSFSISFWFRHAPKTSGTEVMVVKLEASGTDGGYQIQMEADGDITCQIEDVDADTTIDDSISSTAATYDDNRWHYVSCVKSGTSSLTLYIDAQQIIQDAALDASGTLANDDTFYIGIDGDGTSNDFTGFIDEVKVYRSARTADEVKADFTGTTTSRGTAARFGPDQSFLSNGLVGYWKTDESAANSCTGAVNDSCDSSGNANDGAWNGNTTSAAGKFGNSVTLDGTSDYVQVSGLLGSPSNITVSGWANLTSADTSGAEVISLGDHVLIRLDDSAGKTSGYYYDGSDWRAAQVSQTYAGTGWHHFAYVVNDASDKQTLYVDGVEKVSSAYTTSISYSGLGSNTILGTEGNGGTTYDFNGKLDEIRIYNRALSAGEVSRLYNWGSGLLGWWKMDEGSANTCSGGANDACDSSGNGYDGAWNGHATSTNGRFGKGVTFDGTGDYVDAGDIAL